jgi:hypothetical protein
VSWKATCDHIRDNWKTSVSGILTSIIGLSAVASAPNPWINSGLGQKILGASAIAKVVLSVLQKDAKG